MFSKTVDLASELAAQLCWGDVHTRLVMALALAYWSKMRTKSCLRYNNRRRLCLRQCKVFFLEISCRLLSTQSNVTLESFPKRSAMQACVQSAIIRWRDALPDRSNKDIESTKRQVQSQSRRLAGLRVPLLPMPIHSVRLKFSNCCSSAVRLREITQLSHSLPQPLSFKGKLLKSIAWEEPAVASPFHECAQSRLLWVVQKCARETINDHITVLSIPFALRFYAYWFNGIYAYELA